MNQITTTIYPVQDLTKAKAIYRTLLGTEPYVEAPYYIGFKVGEQEFGLDPKGHEQGMTGPLSYVTIPDLRARLAELLNAGATLQQDVRDVGGGKLIASVQDADGNSLGLMQNP